MFTQKEAQSILQEVITDLKMIRISGKKVLMKKINSKTEYSIIQCKACGETRTRYYAGRYKNGKDKRWVDEEGREFSGLKCPQCHSDKTNQTQRLKKALVVTKENDT